MDPNQQPSSAPLTDENQQFGGTQPVVEPTFQTSEPSPAQSMSTPDSMTPVTTLVTPEITNQPVAASVILTTPPLSIQSDVVSTTPIESVAPVVAAAPTKKPVRLWLWVSLAIAVLALVVLVVVLYFKK